MTDDRKPRIKTTDETFGIMDVKPEIVNWIELEPTLQLMKEMGEALDFYSNKTKLDCGELASVKLQKYRKFLEGIEK